MKKKKLLQFSIFVFLSLAVFVSVYLVGKNQLLKKFAEESSASASFSIYPEKTLNRIWPNFSQGGESQEPMLKPAKKQIQLLQPNYIRIDHIFDFPDLDNRVEEIISTGARPFLSLSYFPPSISTELTTIPPSLEEWQRLVQSTIQKYSGKAEKNLLDVYYEVWNEPDLFGKMSPEQYFSLYQASVKAAANCQNCNSFKIGGPAITTLKTDWMNTFLRLVGQNQLRMDFVSWHSYQLNPEKTLWEAQTLKSLGNFSRYFGSKEIIISEWGSVPEVSNLHDSYFDASHTVWAIDKLKNYVDKIFTFELVDGPDPEGKKFWGRWGLLTNQSQGLTPKPRYYPYLYLSKLLAFEMKAQGTSSNITALGSTDGKESYTVLLSRSNGKSEPIPAEVGLIDALPGTYNINTYILDNLSSPLTAQNETLVFSGDSFLLSRQSAPNSVILAEITRTSPSLISSEGRTNFSSDLSAKISSALPPLVFFLNKAPRAQTLEIDFWFKTNWDTSEKQNRIIFENSNAQGKGVTAWFEEESSSSLGIHLGAFDRSTVVEQTKISFPPNKETWHHLTFSINTAAKNISLKLDGLQEVVGLPQEMYFGNFIYLGSSSNRTNYAEGFIDDLTIKADGQTVYQKTFD